MSKSPFSKIENHDDGLENDELKEDGKVLNFKTDKIFNYIQSVKEETQISDESEKEIIGIIENSSFEELDSFLYQLGRNKNKNFIPNKLIKTVLDKSFWHYEQIIPEERNDFLMEDFVCGLQLNIEYKSDKNNTSLADKAFSAFVDLCAKYPQASNDFWMSLSGGAGSIRPDILINGMVNIDNNELLDFNFKQNILFHFLETYSHESDAKSINEGIIELLDFKNSDNFSRTIKVLKFIKKMHSYSEYLDIERPYFSDWSDSENAQNQIKDVIKEKISDNNGSYLLNLYAQDLLDKIAEWEKSSEHQKRLKILEDANTTIFNIAPKVVGYFDKDGLYIAKGEDDVLLPIKISDIKVGKSNQSFKEANEFLADFIFLKNPQMENYIKESFGIKLSEIPLREQAYFLQFIKNKQAKEITPVQDFVKKYGKNGLKTFLSLDYGMNFGDKILTLGKELDIKIAGVIFQKYSEIIDSANNALEYFQNNFSKSGTPDQKIIDGVEEGLFKKGKDVLAHFADKIASGAKINEEDILKELENIKVETFLFISSFKMLEKEGVPVNLADITGGYELNEAVKIKDDVALINQMSRIYRENYKNYPLEFVEELLKSFENSLKNPNTILFTLKHKGELMAFCRLEKELDEDDNIKSYYFGSFNVGPLYKQSRLGESLFEEVLLEAGVLSVPIKADCDPFAPITQKYIKSGFIATGIYDLKGVLSFKIEYNSKLKDSLKSNKFDKEQIINQQIIDDDMVIKSFPAGEKPDFNLLNQGYLLTKYFADKGKIYTVFEKDPRSQEEKEKEDKKAA